MDRPEPSREDFVDQITEIIGQIKPPPTKKQQFLSGLTSFMVRGAYASYSIYLGLLFATPLKYFSSNKTPDREVAGWEIVLAVLIAIYFLRIIFGDVWKDRMTPVKDMASRIISRGLIVVSTFLFWRVVFEWFPGFGNSLMSFVATYFIVSSGYGFRLTGPKAEPLDRNSQNSV